MSAAEARIQAFLASQGKAAALPKAPVQQVTPTAAAPAPAAATVGEPPQQAPPATVEVPAGEGFAVTIDWDGATHAVRCGPDQTVLEAAMDAGIDLPHSCMSGSCLTCAARLSSGTVEQGDGVLEEDQTKKGLMLTCVSYPLEDVSFTIIDESELDE